MKQVVIGESSIYTLDDLKARRDQEVVFLLSKLVLEDYFKDDGGSGRPWPFPQLSTNYNGESFFVRHAYFTGADEPYEKLKRALRAEVDESAWSMLYATVSSPFDPPATGKIAVKVINHYGDEVLKVYNV